MGIYIFASNNCNSHVYSTLEAVWANERPVSREPTFILGLNSFRWHRCTGTVSPYFLSDNNQNTFVKLKWNYLIN